MRLPELAAADPRSCGGKAAGLGVLVRAGVDVPAGFVIPTEEYLRHLHAMALDPAGPVEPAMVLGSPLEGGLVESIGAALGRLLGDPAAGHVAVRSSATTEDEPAASAAGQHDSVLAVRGTAAVCRAVQRCWASLWSRRAEAYRGERPTGAPPAMAVLVQRFVDADVSGVLLTGTPRILEAAPGLGADLVGGRITPDAWTIEDQGSTARRLGVKTHRTDRRGDRLTRRPLTRAERDSLCLTDAQVHALDDLGHQVSGLVGGPADIEWALQGDRIHVLQARPVTAPVRPGPAAGGPLPGELHGTGASPGRATGAVRIVTRAADFHRVGPGDILVCQHTDPAWTPLFRVAGGVVTETGGLLSHAAIVAREVGVPAVVAVPDALVSLREGSTVTVDGDRGVVRFRP